ncbi:MAG: Sua5/YciO/YrdC/YwlC family protein [Pseudomonadales bacterium]|jgi:hypothetical protein|nr:Sua5/YciO/YrdC/YwlC family protein [Pseudomonadales bacterium]
MQKKKCLDYFDKNETVDVYYLEDDGAPKVVASEVSKGKLLIVDIKSVYGITYNPFTPNLFDKLALLKGREKDQFFSLAASYEKLLDEVVDNEKVNPDFFKLNEEICGQMIVRIPHRNLKVENIGNPHNKTVQSLSFEGIHSSLARFQKSLESRGVSFTAGTSANLHRLPAILDPTQVEKFAAAMQLTAKANGMEDLEIIVAHLSRQPQEKTGSYPIVSFINPQQIEIQRYVNKTNREATEKFKTYLENNFNFTTPIVYNLD